MKCAKLELQDRTKISTKEVTNERPRRFCERRLVDPNHQEDITWKNNLERFYYNGIENDDFCQAYISGRQKNAEDLFLSVQNLQFQGETRQGKRLRTSFKYKTLPHRRHRMFVKELVEDNCNESGRFSELTCYYYDDYAKYLLSNDRSRPSSGKSSSILYNFVNNPKDTGQPDKGKKCSKTIKTKLNLKKATDNVNVDVENKDKVENNNASDTKVAYRKSGKRKSLTISRTESPATLQVIRVDVVCNYSNSSSMSEYEDKKPTKTNDELKDKNNGIAKGRQSHFANKYLLTNSVKTLDEKAGGARVTLLCKTFKLADRSRIFAESKAKPLRMKP
ncbi:unnamed protein product [Leptosia nina]|uniref:Uncharacterized protein n=1 Tax=Leptosia nina TaxID=320188 RepID=A0AAV1JZ32_9NEOP